MAVRIGKQCKLYIGTAGTQANTLVGNVRDVTLGLSRDEIDASARDSGDWEEVVSSLKSGEVSFQMRWNTGDANFATIRDAFLNGTAIALLVMDDLTSVVGATGLDADFTILSFSVNQPLRDMVTVDITAKPTPSTRAPAWYTVPTP
jgi:predicted secreted protein